jgi:hypothetical protein
MLDFLKEEVCNVCNSILGNRGRIKLLEAGCGSASHLELKPAVDGVGIDISRAQLERNTMVQEKILGDIQDYPHPLLYLEGAVSQTVLSQGAQRGALAGLPRRHAD